MQVRKEDVQRRHDLIRQGMKKEGLRFLIVVSDWKHKGNLRYLGGRVLWSRWAYIVFRGDAEPVLVAIAPSQRHWAVKEGWIRDVRFAHDPIVEVKTLLNGLSPGERVGIAGLDKTMRIQDYRYLLDQFPKATFVDTSAIVEGARAIKTPGEIEGLVQSARIADEGYQCFKKMIRPGVGHWKIVGEVERILRGQGCYDTMILLSPGPYLREPANEIFRENDFIMFSIELAGPEGYWVEHGGMFYLGKPSRRAVDLFSICNDTLSYARTMLKPGILVADISKKIEEMFKASGYQIGIWGGHGIGLDVLEPPLILPNASGVLEKDMAIGFHPHVVDPSSGLGAYLSDTCIVTPEGGKRLSEIPHEISVIPV